MRIPSTPAGTAALEVATAYCSPALLNHSVRAYLWAVVHAEQQGIAFDDELLFVAAMLHDLGLVKEFDSHTVPFEEAGGHVAWVFGAGAGWPVARRQRLSEVIVRHMWDSVDVAEDPEGHLLELSTAIDISGRGARDLPPDVRSEVLGRYPRLDLVPEFLACFVDQAERKPASIAAGFVRGGFAERINSNPLDSIVE
jgi:hypothetical protein